jgi:hypothetical protein
MRAISEDSAEFSSDTVIRLVSASSSLVTSAEVSAVIPEAADGEGIVDSTPSLLWNFAHTTHLVAGSVAIGRKVWKPGAAPILLTDPSVNTGAVGPV